MKKARWVFLRTKNNSPAQGRVGSGYWALADEDDEVLACVSDHGEVWMANASRPVNGQYISGNFLHELAAKRGAEKWFANDYAYYDEKDTSWIGKV